MAVERVAGSTATPTKCQTITRCERFTRQDRAAVNATAMEKGTSRK